MYCNLIGGLCVCFDYQCMHRKWVCGWIWVVVRLMSWNVFMSLGGRGRLGDGTAAILEPREAKNQRAGSCPSHLSKGACVRAQAAIAHYSVRGRSPPSAMQCPLGLTLLANRSPASLVQLLQYIADNTLPANTDWTKKKKKKWKLCQNSKRSLQILMVSQFFFFLSVYSWVTELNFDRKMQLY